MYELRDYFTEVKNFVSSCSFLENYGVSLNTTEESAAITAELSYFGSEDVSIKQEIMGDYLVTRHEIFNLKLKKNNEDLNIYSFIDNFQRWIDYSNANGATKSITYDENAKVWADSYCEQSNHIIRLHIIDTQKH